MQMSHTCSRRPSAHSILSTQSSRTDLSTGTGSEGVQEAAEHRSIVITDHQLNEFYQVLDVLGEVIFSQAS